MAQPHQAAQSAHAGAKEAVDGQFWALTAGSLGVVYGDIGTSPLYAFREAVMAAIGSSKP